MAKYRIVAMPPKYNLGGLFKKKNKEVVQPGAWAGANPQLVQPGQEGFDLPESQAAPNSEFAIQEMTPEQQAAYLKNARYQEALAGYKPNQSTYKDLARPQGNLVLAEDYEADPNKFTSAGYYPIKTESGNYEMIANKDIANLIYQKGISSQELSDKFNLGDSAELQKNFDPIYKDAAGIHAKRSKEKIDGLIKSGMSKDQAIASLVKQGEGDVQGLNSIYGEYTEDAYQRQKAEAEKLTASSKQPDLKEKFAKFFTEQDEARNAEIEAMKNKIDYSGSLTPSETNINTANKSLGNFGRIGKDAYSANESLKAEVDTAYDNKTEEQKTRPVINALLNSDLTEEQKKEYLSDPKAFQELYNQHTQWDASPAQKQGVFMTASGIPSQDFSFRSDFKISPMTKTSISLPGMKNNSVYNSMIGKPFKTFNYGIPGKEPLDLKISHGNTDWQAARDLKKSAPSGRIDMLDKEWIMGALGLRLLPVAAEAAATVNAWAPLGSVAPNLTVGNAFATKSLYDAGTKYAPNAYKAFQKGQSEGWDNATTGDFAYNTLKTGLSAIPLSSTLKNAKVVKKGKDAFSTVDETISAYKQPDNPEKYYKALKAVNSFIPKQKGGEITLELTDDEIQDYIKRGYEVRETAEPKMQQGGTPSQLWYEYTGTPWSEAKAKGLTDGSMEQNLALAKRIESGEFGKPKVSAPQSQNVSSGYDDMVANMVGQGQTLDQLVASRVGTREGLMYRFPDLFSKAPIVKSKSKTPQQLAAEQKAGKDWLIGKAKELGNEVMGSISNSFWGKAAKKVGQATLNYAIELEKKDRATKKKQEEAKIKKVEKEVKKEVKKVNPAAIQEGLKTPTVQDVLQQAGIRYESNPLKQFTEDKTQPDFGSTLMAQVQQNQQRFGPAQTSKPQQPIANGMGSNFAQGQNIQQLQARNKAIGTSGQNLPEVPGVSIGLKQWGDTDLGNATNQILFDQQYAPENKEQFLETPLGQNIGKGIYDWNKMKNPLISPFGPADLSEDEVMQLQRKLDKEGVIDTPDNLLDSSKIKDKEIKVKPKPDKFTDVLGEVDDSYAPGNPLMSYRSQWDNSEGFRYLATPVYKDRKDQDEYENVIGVGHFLLDASASKSKPYSHEYNKAFIKKAISNNDWVPVFKNEDGDYVRLKYKKANELSKDDKVITPLRQMKFGDLDFNNTKRPKGFKDPVREVLTKDGKGTYLIFKNKDGYSRFSGGSVVFIFKDKYDNTIVRDFAGTLNQIQKEGESIVEKYGLSTDELTLGYHDVGSFSAKPKTPKDGVLKAKQWSSYNTDPMTGGALLIPKSK